MTTLLTRSLLVSLFSLVALCFSPAWAETLLGHCVGVADGDTCTLLLSQEDGSKKTERIRFCGIDAPESHQAYGQAAKKFVSDLIYDKDIRVDVRTHDRYGRLVGTVFVGDTNVNLAVVKAGLAWWYRQYGAGETAIAEAEQAARTARLGLWQDPAPVAPWDFRHKGKNAPSSASATAQPAPAASTTQPSAAEKRYWVTASTGKTHNSSCRYYAKFKGYYSSTGSGDNCKICGGAHE